MKLSQEESDSDSDSDSDDESTCGMVLIQVQGKIYLKILQEY
jgi:hypothetical protein